jgi:hypothetical protein
MKLEHLTETQALELALGEPVDEAFRAHAAACLACARQVAELRSGLRLAAEAPLDDPGDLFLRAARSSIVARVRADLGARRRRTRALWAFAAAASLVLSVLAWSRLGLPVAPAEVPSPAPAWVALPPSADDAGWPVIEDVVPALEDEAWDPAALELVDLSPAESQAFVEALQEELAGRRES